MVLILNGGVIHAYLNAIKPVSPTLGGALRRDQGQIIDFEIKKICAGRGLQPRP
jgi:hypothetical protein